MTYGFIWEASKTTRHAAARLTGFQDSNSFANVDTSSNVTMPNNGSNGDSLPTTVPAAGTLEHDRLP